MFSQWQFAYVVVVREGKNILRAHLTNSQIGTRNRSHSPVEQKNYSMMPRKVLSMAAISD
jgi:hypothetical protein